MGSEAVKVVVRCRPLNDREKALCCEMVLSIDTHRCQCFIEKPGAADEPAKQFTFDGTYFISQTTEQMYNESAYPLIEVSFCDQFRFCFCLDLHSPGLYCLRFLLIFFYRVSLRGTMAPFLPTDKLEVGSLLPCRECLSLQRRGGSFHEPLSTYLRVFR